MRLDLLILVIVALLAAVALAFTHVPGTGPGGGGEPSFECSGFGVTVKACLEAGFVKAVLYRPNPCYRVEDFTVSVVDGVGKVHVSIEPPAPGTVCIQVVPTPLEESVPAPGGVSRIDVEIVDASTGRVVRCSREIG